MDMKEIILRASRVSCDSSRKQFKDSVVFSIVERASLVSLNTTTTTKKNEDLESTIEHIKHAQRCIYDQLVVLRMHLDDLVDDKEKKEEKIEILDSTKPERTENHTSQNIDSDACKRMKPVDIFVYKADPTKTVKIPEYDLSAVPQSTFVQSKLFVERRRPLEAASIRIGKELVSREINLRLGEEPSHIEEEAHISVETCERLGFRMRAEFPDHDDVVMTFGVMDKRTYCDKVKKFWTMTKEERETQLLFLRLGPQPGTEKFIVSVYKGIKNQGLEESKDSSSVSNLESSDSDVPKKGPILYRAIVTCHVQERK